MIRPPSPADIRPSTPPGDLFLRALADLVPPIALDACPVCGELVAAPELDHPDGACLACVTGPAPRRETEEPAQRLARLRLRHRPTVAVDLVVRRGGTDSRAEGGAP